MKTKIIRLILVDAIYVLQYYLFYSWYCDKMYGSAITQSFAWWEMIVIIVETFSITFMVLYNIKKLMEGFD